MKYRILRIKYIIWMGGIEIWGAFQKRLESKFRENVIEYFSKMVVLGNALSNCIIN